MQHFNGTVRFDSVAYVAIYLHAIFPPSLARNVISAKGEHIEEMKLCHILTIRRQKNRAFCYFCQSVQKLPACAHCGTLIECLTFVNVRRCVSQANVNACQKQEIAS